MFPRVEGGALRRVLSSKSESFLTQRRVLSHRDLCAPLKCFIVVRTALTGWIVASAVTAAMLMVVTRWVATVAVTPAGQVSIAVTNEQQGHTILQYVYRMSQHCFLN